MPSLPRRKPDTMQIGFLELLNDGNDPVAVVMVLDPDTSVMPPHSRYAPFREGVKDA